MDQSAPSVTRPELAALLLILASALALRLPAIGWGLPPAIPHVVASDIRSSYSFDEDDVLTSASFTQPAKLNFDVHMYHWGTLHLEITAVWLELVQAVGMFRGPWREAYYQMVPGFFERVYVAGRMLSILIGLISIILVYLLGREIENRSAALWAAAVLAASPVHLLGSTQIRVDMTMMALLTLTAWLGARAQKQWQPWRLIALGFAGGLAVTAKYPAIFAVLPILAAVVATSRFRFRATAFISMGTSHWMHGGPTVSLDQVSGDGPTDSAAPRCANADAIQVFGNGVVVVVVYQYGAISDRTRGARSGCRRNLEIGAEARSSGLAGSHRIGRNDREPDPPSLASAALPDPSASVSCGSRGYRNRNVRSRVAMAGRMRGSCVSSLRQPGAASLHDVVSSSQPDSTCDSRHRPTWNARFTANTRAATARLQDLSHGSESFFRGSHTRSPCLGINGGPANPRVSCSNTGAT